MRKTYATGHKNPDTDSISAALAISELKGMLGENVIPIRLGTLSEETKFATKYFNIEAPILLNDARTLLADIEMDYPVQIKADVSVNNAYKIITSTHNKTLYITDKEHILSGVVSLGDLASMKLREQSELDHLLAQSTIELIAKDTGSQIIVKSDYNFRGTVHILSSKEDQIEENSIILCRSKNIRYALEKKPTLIIFTEEEKEDSESCFLTAQKMNISVLKCPKSLEKIVLQIYYCIPVSLIMSTQPVSFLENEFVEDVREEIMKTRFRSYPVVDKNYHLVGSISRYHLFNYPKNQFILVDHSSSAQSINHLYASDVIEIIDHHHIGDIQTKSPIDYRNRKCGCTCSIIYSMYVENGLLPTKKIAGMMLSAIISDTLNFKSQTTVHSDIIAAKALARISEVNLEEYASQLLNASVNLKDVNIVEVIERDLKEYRFGKYKLAVGQTNYGNLKDIQPRISEFKSRISEYQKDKDYDLFIMMFTNVNGDGTFFIYSGSKSSLMSSVIENVFDDSSGFDSHIMSRKQQLIPILGKLLEEA